MDYKYACYKKLVPKTPSFLFKLMIKGVHRRLYLNGNICDYILKVRSSLL